jgi:hypothetical protein
MKITNGLGWVIGFLIITAVLRYERADPSTLFAASAAKTSALLVSVAQATRPKTKGARMKDKNLIVTGENFDDGAIILLNGNSQKTSKDRDSHTIVLLAKKAGKKLAPNQIVLIQVQYPNGLLSEGLAFHTGCGSQD